MSALINLLTYATQGKTPMKYVVALLGLRYSLRLQMR